VATSPAAGLNKAPTKEVATSACHCTPARADSEVARLVGEHAPLARRVVPRFRRLHGPGKDDEHDLVSTALSRLWVAARGHAHGPERFVPFAVRVIWHGLLAHRHSKAARRARCAGLGERPGVRQRHAFEEAEDCEALLGRLRPAERLLALRRAEGVKMAEIAAELCKPKSTVEKMLRRVRRRLACERT